MNRERAAVVGIGRIGLCFALNLERCGYHVLGVDHDVARVAQVYDRTLQTPEPGVDEALRGARWLTVADRIVAVRDFHPSTVFVAVDTPTAEDGGYDPRHVDAVLHDLLAHGPAPGPTDLVLLSTVMPGYCDGRAPEADAGHYRLSYSPGFVAQGSIMRDQQCPAQVLIGEADAAAGTRIEQIYRRTCRNQPSVHRMPRLAAEIAKLATNAFLTMKIAFANAIGDLAVRADADPERVLAAVGADPRVGTAFLRYGFGYGGPCLPRDNRALNLFAAERGCRLLQAEATDAMNERHRAFQLEELRKTHPEDEPIHVDLLSYKPGTDILVESQRLALAVELARSGRRVVIHERPGVVAEVRALFGDLFEYRGRQRSRAESRRADAVV